MFQESKKQMPSNNPPSIQTDLSAMTYGKLVQTPSLQWKENKEATVELRAIHTPSATGKLPQLFTSTQHQDKLSQIMNQHPSRV
jgi:hypothetical protein